MLQLKLHDDLTKAQLKRDEVAVSTLRLLLSEISYAQIAKREELDDPDIISVIQREVKKRKEAALGFRQGGREEQALKEEAESEVLQKYLPRQLSDEELTNIIENSIQKVGAKNIADMGEVIGLVMGQVAGQADGSRVSALVKEKLNG